MDKRLIVIPFNLPWNWSTDYTNQTAFELARRGHVVVCYLWAEACSIWDFSRKKHKVSLVKRLPKNIYVITPIHLIPFRRFKFIAELNIKINIIFLRLFSDLASLIYKCQNNILWIFDPNLHFFYNYFRKRYSLLYDCVDFFAVGDKKTISETIKNEKKLVKDAGLVTANSTVLRKHLLKYRENVVLVPQGFRMEEFVVDKDKYINLKVPHPIIGFVGGINDRLDLSILSPLVNRNPKWSFILWGPLQMQEKMSPGYWNKLQEILNMPNVKIGVSNDKAEIPGLVSQFDVCIIPYDIKQNFNKYCYPMKLFEYFYFGKPVVSTDVIELRRFASLVKIGTNYKEWQKILNGILSTKWSKKNIINELKYAKENSWDRKIEAILNSL